MSCHCLLEGLHTAVEASTQQAPLRKGGSQGAGRAGIASGPLQVTSGTTSGLHTCFSTASAQFQCTLLPASPKELLTCTLASAVALVASVASAQLDCTVPSASLEKASTWTVACAVALAARPARPSARTGLVASPTSPCSQTPALSSQLLQGCRCVHFLSSLFYVQSRAAPTYILHQCTSRTYWGCCQIQYTALRAILMLQEH